VSVLYSHKDYCKQVPQPLPNSGRGFAPGQSVAILPNPLMQCSTIANVRCGGTQGCCSGGGCCGAGCCGLTAICINQNTHPVCCSLGDPTRCGTKRPSAPQSTPKSGGGGGNGCTKISNCLGRGGKVWTCLLGQTCGLSYPNCNPCPTLLGKGRGN